MATFSLIRLPKSFVELYGIVNKVKGRDDSGTVLDDNDDAGSAETAICLLTGSVMRSGSSRRPPHRAVSTFDFYIFTGFSFCSDIISYLVYSNVLLAHALCTQGKMGPVSVYSSWFKSVQYFSCTTTSRRILPVCMSTSMVKKTQVYAVAVHFF